MGQEGLHAAAAVGGPNELQQLSKADHLTADWHVAHHPTLTLASRGRSESDVVAEM
jgi:hypothetical protein